MNRWIAWTMITLLLLQPGMAAVYGQLKIQIDQHKIREYDVVQALLLENVSIQQDTFLQVQHLEGYDILYYPQIHKGSRLLLHLIAQPSEKENEDFYDIFFLLGDTLSPSLQFTDQDSMAFIQKNGRLLRYPAYARHVNALFQLTREKGEKTFSGSFSAEFDYPVFPPDSTTHHIWMEGKLTVPSGRYRETSLSSQSGLESQQKTFERNLALALILIVITITAIGL